MGRPADRFAIGDATVDAAAGEIRGANGVRHVSPKAMEVLVLLAGCAGQVVERTEILDRAWEGRFVGDQVVSNAIWELRAALGHESRRIETVPKRGYRLTAPVRVLAQSPERALRRGSGEAVPSVAVLPLENLSGDPSEEYFSDGLTDALISRLAAVPALGVIARVTSMAYKGTPKPARQIGSELGVAHLVTGSTIRSHDLVRVSLQLVDVATERHLWAESLDLAPDDVLPLHDELGSRTAAAIGQALDVPFDSAGQRPPSPNPAAYELFLRGQYLLNRSTYEEIESGLALLRRSVVRDPSFAPAHAEIARGLYALSAWGRSPGVEMLPSIIEAAGEALSLEPDHPEAGIWLALAEGLGRWSPADAERKLESLLRRWPNHPGVRSGLARCRAARGRLQEAVEEQLLALSFDPLSPALATGLGFYRRAQGRFEQALAQCRRALDLDPDWSIARLELARCLLAAGGDDAAIAALERAEPSWARFLRQVKEGHRSKARSALLDWEKDYERDYVAPYWLAERWMWLGDHERALDWLERAFHDRQLQAMFVGIEPTFAPIRAEPRFRRILERLGWS